MTAQTPIVALWKAGKLPIEDGLFFAEAPDWVTSIDITRETSLPDGRGHICAGEGPHGSEGSSPGSARLAS